MITGKKKKHMIRSDILDSDKQNKYDMLDINLRNYKLIKNVLIR